MIKLTPLRQLGLAFIIASPSLAMFPKYSVFLPIPMFIILAGITGLTNKVVKREATAWRMILYIILWLICLFAIAQAWVPEVDSGGDRDEALDIAVRELLTGNYPYSPQTHLGKPISPLPGALLLAAPFVLLGNSAYQNFFWLSVLVIAFGRWYKDAKLTFVLLIAILASPMIFLDILFGGDLLANNIYFLVALVWFVQTRYKSPASVPWWPSVFLGVALASRPNFLFWLPLTFAFLLSQGQNLIWLTKRLLIAVFLAGALTLPFYLYDPSHFSPLHTLAKVDVVPSLHVGAIIVVITALCALGLSFFTKSQTALFFSGSMVQAIPVVLVVGLSIVTQETPVLLNDRTSYAMNLVLPGILAVLSYNPGKQEPELSPNEVNSL